MKQRICALLTGLLAAGACTAQGPQSFSFSLQQSVEYALQNQVNVQNAVLDEQIAKGKVNEVLGLGFPQVSGSIDVKDFLEIPTSVIPGEFFGGPPGSFTTVQFGTQYSATAGINASQLVFSSDYLVGLKATKVFLELSQKATVRTRIETAAAVSKAYYMVLVNDERMKLVNANIDRLKKLMDDTKVLFDNGFVEKIDYDRITVAYNNLLVEKEKIAKLFELALALLKYQMGMEQNAALTLTDKLAGISFKPDLSLEKFDYSKRIEYSLFQTQLGLSQLQLKKDKMSYLPSFVLYGSVSANAFRNQFDFFDTGQRWYPTVVIGGTIGVPIFAGGQKHYRIQQSRLAVIKAENNLKFMQQSIDLDMAGARIALQNASSSLETQKKNIELAENVYKTAKLKYDQGVGSNLEVMTAETALKEAQTNYYNALYEALVAKIDYNKANGTLIK
ncbi:MAG: TolC family protein [Bacteroidota bacterium]